MYGVYLFEFYSFNISDHPDNKPVFVASNEGFGLLCCGFTSYPTTWRDIIVEWLIKVNIQKNATMIQVIFFIHRKSNCKVWEKTR